MCVCFSARVQVRGGRETEGKRETYRIDKEEKVETNYIIDICMESGAR